MRLNKTAVYNRIESGEEWLKWPCETLCRRRGLLVEKPAWLEGKDVCLVDTSEEVTMGNKKRYFQSRYEVDIFTLGIMI
jgi:hypothetical protein